MTVSGPNLNHTVQHFAKACEAVCGHARSGLRSLRGVGIAAVLGIAGSSGLMGVALSPQPAAAQTAPLSQSLQRLPQESYEQFIQRAEIAADATVDRYFSQYPQAGQVALTVIGASEGLQAPVLLVDITRSQWQGLPNLERQTTYFPSTRILLGFATPTPEDDDVGLPEAATDANADTQDSVISDTVIQTPTGESLTGGRSVNADDPARQGPIQPETSFTTPLEEVAPLELDPDAGVTNSGGEFDFEDTNDFEFLPDQEEADPFDVNPPSGIPNSNVIDLEDRPQVIDEPASQ